MTKKLITFFFEKLDRAVTEGITSRLSNNMSNNSFQQLQINTKALYDEIYGETSDKNPENSE